MSPSLAPVLEVAGVTATVDASFSLIFFGPPGLSSVLPPLPVFVTKGDLLASEGLLAPPGTGLSLSLSFPGLGLGPTLCRFDLFAKTSSSSSSSSRLRFRPGAKSGGRGLEIKGEGGRPLFTNVSRRLSSSSSGVDCDGTTMDGGIGAGPFVAICRWDSRGLGGIPGFGEPGRSPGGMDVFGEEV